MLLRGTVESCPALNRSVSRNDSARRIIVAASYQPCVRQNGGISKSQNIGRNDLLMGFVGALLAKSLRQDRALISFRSTDILPTYRFSRCGLLAIETDIGLNSGVVRSPVQALDWFVQGFVGPESGMGAVFVGIANID